MPTNADIAAARAPVWDYVRERVRGPVNASAAQAEPRKRYETSLHQHGGRIHFQAKRQDNGGSIMVSLPIEASAGEQVHINIKGLPLDFIRRLDHRAKKGNSTCIPIPGCDVVLFLKDQGAPQ